MAKYEDIYKRSQDANNENMSPLEARLSNAYASADRTYADTVALAEQARQNAVYDAQNAYKTSMSNYGRAAETALGNGMRGSGYSSYADAAAYNAQRGEVAVANSKYADAVRQAQYTADQQKYAANDAYEQGLQGSYENLAQIASQGALSKDEILKMAGSAGIKNAGQLETLGTLAGKSYDEMTRIPMLEEAYNAGLQGNVIAYNQFTDDEAKKRVVDGVIDSVKTGSTFDIAKLKDLFGANSEDYKRVETAVTDTLKPALVGIYDGKSWKNDAANLIGDIQRPEYTDDIKVLLVNKYISAYGKNEKAMRNILSEIGDLRSKGVEIPDTVYAKALKSFTNLVKKERTSSTSKDDKKPSYYYGLGRGTSAADLELQKIREEQKNNSTNQSAGNRGSR